MYLRHGQITSSESYTDQKGVKQTYDFIGHQTDFYSYFTPKIGYRFQKPKGGFFMRFTFTPQLAGINRIGNFQGGKIRSSFKPEIQYFNSVAFFDTYKIIPWFGFSFGFTLK
jgi:hypothetical protein